MKALVYPDRIGQTSSADLCERALLLMLRKAAYCPGETAGRQEEVCKANFLYQSRL